MGARKQRWTAEEEAALKAGIAKYGAGQWRTILRDPEFSTVLLARSNVDLKDKWRNINVMANGWGSRQKGRFRLEYNQPIPRANETSVVPGANLECDMEIADVKPLAFLDETVQNGSSERPIPRLDNLILETIANLKELSGSNLTAIFAYIEERFPATPNLERLLATELKLLTDNGKLIKVKHRYRSVPTPSFGLRKNPSILLLEQKQTGSTRAETTTTNILTKAQIDTELEAMRSMTKWEAAAAAARAVAEAEASVAEAEEAEREAEAAEAEAEVAKAFAAAATKALNRSTL